MSERTLLFRDRTNPPGGEARTRRVARLAFAVMVLAALPRGAAGRDNLETERALIDAMLTPQAIAPTERQGALVETERAIARQLLEEENARTRSWAVLPQVGFSPEKGANGGIKYVNRNFTRANLGFDLEASYAIEGQRGGSVAASIPHLWGGRLVFLLEGDVGFDPTKEFFGLGNNDVGPDALATHEHETFFGAATFGVRPLPRLTVAVSAGFKETRLRRGELEGDTPSTIDAFPVLPGIRGGRTSPLSFSFVYNNREDTTRPTRGWSILGKIQHVNRGYLRNDFHYTRYIFDASYLRPLLTRRQILGLRVGGEFMDAKRGEAPFFDLSSLGGSRDLRGFFQDRFLGRSRIMINGEYRLKLFDFSFLDVWQVRIDGVAFGDMGRVFIDDGDLRQEFGIDTALIERVIKDFQFSYGGGARFALGRALIARVDVGFSEEETALIYLTFGHTF